MLELWAKSMKRVGNCGRHFPAVHPQNPRSKYARVPHMMAQFALKIEKLSHTTGTALILERARACGLRPRLFLLVVYRDLSTKTQEKSGSVYVSRSSHRSNLNGVALSIDDKTND